MEPLTTTAAISVVVTYITTKLKANKSIQSLFDDFAEATVNWIKPILVREDGSPKDYLNDLKNNPNSKAQQNIVKNTIEVALEKDPGAISYLQEMLKTIYQKDSQMTKSNIINQYHSGSGDNVSGDKIINQR